MMARMKRWAITIAMATLCLPQAAEAFCGFYVSGSDQQLAADATQVVLMRKGTRTVLSMQNNYKGPPEAFAMVIPVPTVLKEADVKTLKTPVLIISGDSDVATLEHSVKLFRMLGGGAILAWRQSDRT